jgi:FkbM family methyltransferase
MSLANKINGIRGLWQFDNRWQLILARLFSSNEKLSCYRYRGLEIVADRIAGEAHIVTEVLTTSMYKENFREMNLKSPLNVLDIGSNIGCFPLALRSEDFEIKKLACIELNPRTFSRLRFNIERNFDSGFELINGAVCGSERELEMTLGAGGAHDNIYENAVNGKTWRLPGYTFDDIYRRTFGEEDVDLCKMDIEGAEFEVFANPGHESIKKCRNLLIEIHHETETPRDLVRDKLNELGFTEHHGESKTDSNHYVHYFSRI